MWIVPTGVSSVTFDVLGAQGADASGSSGGLGGATSATLAVNPGQTFQIYVGGAGTIGAGGYNGGGRGGSAVSNQPAAGGGGGASDVRTGFGLAERIIVAGGGGGAAGSGTNGGAGGGTNGGNADGRSGGNVNVSGGAGGTPTGGGAGGTANCYPPSPGESGASGRGGNGFTFNAGGGGGGYFGGGGGSNCNGGTGGGGGSGYSSAPGGTFQSGVRSGNGQVTITYTVLTPRTVVAYDPTGARCSCDAVPPASVVTTFTASELSQVGMLGGWANTDVWPVGQIGPSSSVNPGQYLTFSVTPNRATRYTSLSLSEQSYVGQGPRNAVVRTSLDGFETDAASVSGLNPAGVNQIVFNLADLPMTSGQVEFRVYFFNPPSSGEDWADLVSTNRGATGLILTAEVP
jgi:hypothetical protein